MKGKLKSAVKGAKEKVVKSAKEKVAKAASARASASKPAGKAVAKPAAAVKSNGIKKKYLKSRPVCKVTFMLPKEAAADAQMVSIAGNFNNWDPSATPLSRQKNGSYAITMELQSGAEYRYRYLINGERWENDWCADKYEPNPFGGDDSIVVL